MRQTSRERSAFFASGEPGREPDYMDTALRLRDSLSPEQQTLLAALLDRFGELVQYERRWYFHRGYEAAKRETPD